MFELSENALVTFFAGEAQIFGALLGLLGLSFVRGAETIERNFTQHLNSLVAELMEIVEKAEKTKDLNISIRSNEELGHFIDKYRHKMPAKKYDHIRYQFRELERESSLKKALARRFKLNCWLSFGLIVVSTAGLMVPVAQFPFEASVAAAAVFAVSVVALVLVTRFFIEITKTTSVFIFGKS